MYTIVIEAPTLLNRTFCGAAERFQIELVRSFTVSTSVGEGKSRSCSVISSGKKAILRDVIVSNNIHLPSFFHD